MSKNIIFLSLFLHKKKNLNKIEWKELNLKERQQVSEILTPEIGDYNSSYIYVEGKYATFHSGSDINEDRFFFSFASS